MLSNLFIAEWKKIAGNRRVTGCFIWIFPIAAFALMAFLLFVVIVSENARNDMILEGAEPWYEVFMGTWPLVNNEVIRWMIAAFTAVVFASEYQYNTWKILITHRSRYVLILNKFVTIGAFVLVSWVSLSLITGIGYGIIVTYVGLDYGEFSGEIFREFLGDYAFQMFISLTTTLIAACYAALAAMITRSIITSVFVAILINIAETAILLPLILLKGILDIDYLRLYLYTPTYNLSNINLWVTEKRGYILDMGMAEDGALLEYGPHSLAGSLIIVAFIVALLIAFTLLRFVRQDITD